MVRVLQCVAPVGLVCSVASTSSATRAGSVLRFAPAAGRDLPHTANALFPDAPPPQRHGASVNPELFGRLLRGFAGGRFDDDPCSQHDLLRRRSRADPLRETKPFFFRQNHRSTCT
ncbi:MAG: hypothetical protein ABIZ81_02925 [Opitutaceae bacterium]